jgi:hypothetical protein
MNTDGGYINFIGISNLGQIRHGCNARHQSGTKTFRAYNGANYGGLYPLKTRGCGAAFEEEN